MQRGQLRFVHSLLPSIHLSLPTGQASAVRQFFAAHELTKPLASVSQHSLGVPRSLALRVKRRRVKHRRRPTAPAPRVLKIIWPRNYKRPSKPTKPKQINRRVHLLPAGISRLGRFLRFKRHVKHWPKLRLRLLLKNNWMKRQQRLALRRVTPKWSLAASPIRGQIGSALTAFRHQFLPPRPRLERLRWCLRRKGHLNVCQKGSYVFCARSRDRAQRVAFPWRRILQTQLRAKLKINKPKVPKLHFARRRALIKPLALQIALPQHQHILLLSLLANQPVLNYSLKYCRLSRRVRKILKNKYRFSKYFFAIAPHKRQLYTIRL